MDSFSATGGETMKEDEEYVIDAHDWLSKIQIGKLREHSERLAELLKLKDMFDDMSIEEKEKVNPKPKKWQRIEGKVANVSYKNDEDGCYEEIRITPNDRCEISGFEWDIHTSDFLVTVKHRDCG